MSTSNLFDIPDFYREKLKSQQPDIGISAECIGQELESASEASDVEQNVDSESILVEGETEINSTIAKQIDDETVLGSQSCRDGNCMPPPHRPGCRGGNCPPPPPPHHPGCRGGNCPPPPPHHPGCRGGNCPPPPPHRPGCRGGNCPPPRHPYPQYAFHPCPMGTFCRKGENMMPPMPFFKSHPSSLRLQEEIEDLHDMDMLQERYPKNARMIKMLVDEQADRMDYDGSMIFDESPDKVHIEKIVNEIYNRFMEEMSNPNADMENLEGECEGCSNLVDENTLKELIMVLLYQEMFRRRCKNRRCNRWW